MAIAVAPAASNPLLTHSKRTRTQITEEAATSAAKATRSNAPSAKRQRPSRTPAGAVPVTRQPPHHKQQREETSEGGDAEVLPASDTAAACQADSGMAATAASSGSAPDERFAAAAQFSEDDDDALGSDEEAATAGEVTDNEPEVAAVKKVTKSKGKLSEDKLQRMKKAYEKRGVVYISRIPPHMKPLKMRHMLASHGEIGRLYLAPEDSAARKKRKKAGGNTGKNFTEGWVEFEDKSVAKYVAGLLNGQQMGGKRRSAYHYDLWSMKYLPKFKWDHLTEEISYQNAVREQKLAAEISAATRERDFYLSRVDRAKGNAAIKARKEKLQAEGGDGTGSGKPSSTPRAGSGAGSSAKPGAEPGVAVASKAPLRMYGQRQPKADPVTDAHAPKLSSDVLSMIAGRK